MTHQPADTRLMGIIHESLRRDLRRTRTALTAESPPPPDQRQAIAEHLTWMLQFLHDHHHTEDFGLYPMVVARDPSAREMVERMAADHRRVAADIEALQRAVSDYGRLDTAREQLLAAVDALEGSLLPHLRQEEDEMMPLVSAAITDAELRRWDHEENIKPKSLTQLAREGHWLLDGLGSDDRHFLLHLLPAVQRFTLLHGFGRAYRRRAEACWGRAVRTKRRVQMHGRTRVVVDAGIGDVWDVVRDPTRVGEWSHECHSASWLDGATEAVPGARFRGRNQQGIMRWGRVCEVIAAEPYEFVFRTVPTFAYPDSSEWRIRLEATDGGTAIEQSFDVVKSPKLLSVVYATLLPAHRNRDAALADDLRRIGARASAQQSQRAA